MYDNRSAQSITEIKISINEINLKINTQLAFIVMNNDKRVKLKQAMRK